MKINGIEIELEDDLELVVEENGKRLVIRHRMSTMKAAPVVPIYIPIQTPMPFVYPMYPVTITPTTQPWVSDPNITITCETTCTSEVCH